MRALPALALVAALSACGHTITTINPAPTAFTTFGLRAGTIDPTHPCTPATPPAPLDPTPPAAQEVLVGYQDWRNTVTTAGGSQCQTSNAKRWLGIVTFDMTPVRDDLAASTFRSLTGTLTYDPTSIKVPQAFNVLEMCAARLEVAATPPTSTGLVQLNAHTGQSFPASASSSLGVITLPASVPFGQVTRSGPVTVDPAPPFPTVTVDVTMILSDWAAARPASLALVFLPQGPTVAALGVTSGTPVPPDRNVQCVSVLRRLGMTVSVGR